MSQNWMPTDPRIFKTSLLSGQGSILEDLGHLGPHIVQPAPPRPDTSSDVGRREGVTVGPEIRPPIKTPVQPGRTPTPQEFTEVPLTGPPAAIPTGPPPTTGFSRGLSRSRYPTASPHLQTVPINTNVAIFNPLEKESISGPVIFSPPNIPTNPGVQESPRNPSPNSSSSQVQTSSGSFTDSLKSVFNPFISAIQPQQQQQQFEPTDFSQPPVTPQNYFQPSPAQHTQGASYFAPQPSLSPYIAQLPVQQPLQPQNSAVPNQPPNLAPQLSKPPLAPNYQPQHQNSPVPNQPPNLSPQLSKPPLAANYQPQHQSSPVPNQPPNLSPQLNKPPLAENHQPQLQNPRQSPFLPQNQLQNNPPQAPEQQNNLLPQSQPQQQQNLTLLQNQIPQQAPFLPQQIFQPNFPQQTKPPLPSDQLLHQNQPQQNQLPQQASFLFQDQSNQSNLVQQTKPPLASDQLNQHNQTLLQYQQRQEQVPDPNLPQQTKPLPPPDQLLHQNQPQPNRSSQQVTFLSEDQSNQSNLVQKTNPPLASDQLKQHNPTLQQHQQHQEQAPQLAQNQPPSTPYTPAALKIPSPSLVQSLTTASGQSLSSAAPAPLGQFFSPEGVSAFKTVATAQPTESNSLTTSAFKPINPSSLPSASNFFSSPLDNSKDFFSQGTFNSENTKPNDTQVSTACYFQPQPQETASSSTAVSSQSSTPISVKTQESELSINQTSQLLNTAQQGLPSPVKPISVPHFTPTQTSSSTNLPPFFKHPSEPNILPPPKSTAPPATTPPPAYSSVGKKEEVAENPVQFFNPSSLTIQQPPKDPENTYRLGSGLRKPSYAPVPDLAQREQENQIPMVIKSQSPPADSGTPVPSHGSGSISPDVYLRSNSNAFAYKAPIHHWFFKKGGKTSWEPFSMADSLNLEQVFTSPEITEETKVATDGGRYDVEVLKRKKIAVYWEEPPSEVRRCSWFVKAPVDSRYIPYDENIAEILEDAYKTGCLRNEWNRRVELADGEVIILHSPNAIAHHQRSCSPDAWGNPPPMQQKPRIVKRGLDDFDISRGEPNQVDHLLLVVHGIGKFCDLRFRSLVEVVDDFRTISLQLIQSHFRSASECGNVGRIEVLPVEWHRALHTEAIDQRLADITLPSIPKAREFTNETLLDILFYTSPVFAEKIAQAVGAELNRVYNLYINRNPNFRGGVSLGGHSLGSLILFDMLSHQKVTLRAPMKPQSSIPESEEEDLPDISYLKTKAKLSRRMSFLTMGTTGTGQPYSVYPQLHFHPKCFFAMGSPIGMFVTVRGIEALGEDFKFTTCPKFFNIFHPNDPVAYRIEALIVPGMAKVPAVLIPHHKGRKRMHLELKETMAHVTAALKQKLVDSVRSTWNAVYQLAMFQRPDLNQEVNKALDDEALRTDDVNHSSLVHQSQTIAEEQGLDLKVGSLNEGCRIDYVLQEAPLETFNQYISAVRSHVVYWESEDTMLLILKELYSTMGISQDSQVPQQMLPFDIGEETYTEYTDSIGAPPTQFIRK